MKSAILTCNENPSMLTDKYDEANNNYSQIYEPT